MSRPAALEIAWENASFELGRALAASARAQHRDPAVLAAVSECHHTLGLVALLADADPEEFARCLARSAQAGLRMRQLDLSEHPELGMASNWFPFADALASGSVVLARSLAERAPTVVAEGYEYEDDAWRASFLYRACLGEGAGPLGEVLDRWAAVAVSDPGPYHALSRAIAAQDAGGFDEAMAQVLARRWAQRAAWRKTPAYRVEVDATEGSVFVLGLAYLRLAELRGIETRLEYQGMPSLARGRDGAAALGADAWAVAPAAP